MCDCLNEVIETVLGSDFWRGVAGIMLGLFSITGLFALLEWRRITKRLKKDVTNYIDAVEFEWRNQTEEFIVMDRIRAFEVLLKDVQSLRPTTPGAYKRVQQVRDAVEFFHRARAVLNEEHLPLPKPDEFPLPTTHRTAEGELFVRQKVLEELRKNKWLGLEKPVKPSNAEPS